MISVPTKIGWRQRGSKQLRIKWTFWGHEARRLEAITYLQHVVTRLASLYPGIFVILLESLLKSLSFNLQNQPCACAAGGTSTCPCRSILVEGRFPAFALQGVLSRYSSGGRCGMLVYKQDSVQWGMHATLVHDHWPEPHHPTPQKGQYQVVSWHLAAWCFSNLSQLEPLHVMEVAWGLASTHWAQGISRCQQPQICFEPEAPNGLLHASKQPIGHAVKWGLDRQDRGW